MHIPSEWHVSRGWTDSLESLLPASVRRQVAGIEGDQSATSQALTGQWASPTDVSTILMVIGGDVVQKALAQGTGLPYFTPVCFSFGWVSYAFMALVSIIGDGRLLPPPDYPVKVLNLRSGYARDNKSWVVGRLLRDLESEISKSEPLDDNAIRISIYGASDNMNGLTEFSRSKSHLIALVFILLQFLLAILPVVLYDEWDIIMILGAGTALAQIAGSLPQWRAEKLPNRQHKKDVYALTQGNGSREIFVIFGNGRCLDLEELAASPTPRSGRPWEKFIKHDWFSMPRSKPDDFQAPPRRETQLRKSRDSQGLPLGFWLTKVVVICQSILWLLLLVNVSTPRRNNWYLLAIGAVGMFQNAFSAGSWRSSEERNLPLRFLESIKARKVMDGIMDFEVQYSKYSIARPLLREFFPGDLKDDEKEWWRGNRDPYDHVRETQKNWRKTPQSRLPPKLTHRDILEPWVEKPQMYAMPSPSGPPSSSSAFLHGEYPSTQQPLQQPVVTEDESIGGEPRPFRAAKYQEKQVKWDDDLATVQSVAVSQDRMAMGQPRESSIRTSRDDEWRRSLTRMPSRDF